jgi:glycosyltransferase involved in cell wall biosynthesis
MTRVHLVYPHRRRISNPHSRGWKMGEHLRALGYDVVHYNIGEAGVIEPGTDDVLLGHPHPAPWTIFRRSVKRPGWKRRLMLLPYNHGDNVQVAFADPVIRHCDLYLAITGPTWFESVSESLFSHWRPKMVHVDGTVDREDFPVVKTSFNAPGERRFVYIGHAKWFKNTGYLSEIAKSMPGVDFGWMGADGAIDGLRAHGRLDFGTDEARELVSGYDFMITVGSSDANPRTILEAMAWGLVPVCTRESGYAGYPGIVNVPLADVDGAARVLRELQALPESRLREMQAANWEALDAHFTFDRFMRQIVEAIESPESPALLPVSLRRTLAIRWHALRSPYSIVRPSGLRSAVRAALGTLGPGRALLERRRRRWAARQTE